LQQEEENGIAELRVKSRTLLQELNVQLLSKVEELKLELAEELSHRERRRRVQLEELKREMGVVETVLKKGKDERELGRKERECMAEVVNEGIVNALGQLEELKEKMNAELLAREKNVERELGELQSGWGGRLDAMKEQLVKEVKGRECKIDKELEEMKLKFQIGFNLWNANFSSVDSLLQHSICSPANSPSSSNSGNKMTGNNNSPNGSGGYGGMVGVVPSGSPGSMRHHHHHHQYVQHVPTHHMGGMAMHYHPGVGGGGMYHGNNGVGYHGEGMGVGQMGMGGGSPLGGRNGAVAGLRPHRMFV